jgi:glycosyltransferase involved in cell wall biosynthesis
MELVSIILPVYNAEKYLEKSISSILQQTYTNLEVIIIDDGSTDGSFEIIESFAKSDCRIISISRSNKGLVETLNEGISIATGKYIVRMDADDVSYFNRIEEQVDFLRKNLEYVIVGSWADVIDVNGDIVGVYNYPKVNDFYIRIGLFWHNQFIHPSVMIRSGVLKECGYSPKFKHVEDYELWTRILKYGKGHNLDKSLIKYRILETSITRQNRSKMHLFGLYVRVLAVLRLLLPYYKVPRT